MLRDMGGRREDPYWKSHQRERSPIGSLYVPVLGAYWNLIDLDLPGNLFQFLAKERVLGILTKNRDTGM